MAEKSSCKTLREKLAASPKVHVQRIEDMMSRGIPDINFCFNEHEVWVECKELAELPKRESTLIKVGLKPEQARWLNTRDAAGGCVFVMIRCRFDNTWKLGWKDFDKLVKGLTLDEFNAWGYTYSSCNDVVKHLLGYCE